MRETYEKALYPSDPRETIPYLLLYESRICNELIAQELDRDVSTIKRKLSRNMGLRGYPPQQAHCLAQQWSPEQIQRRLIRQYLPKDQPLDKVTKKQVVDIQTRLNQRPLKKFMQK